MTVMLLTVLLYVTMLAKVLFWIGIVTEQTLLELDVTFSVEILIPISLIYPI